MLNVDELRNIILNLLREYPDLADDEILRADMLDGETNLNEVLSELFNSADDAKAMVASITMRATELGVRRARLVRRIEFLRGLMLKLLQAADLRKVELACATLSQRNSPPQLIGEVIPENLPDDLCKVTREANRTKIREALIEGRELPGLALSNGPPALAISTK